MDVNLVAHGSLKIYFLEFAHKLESGSSSSLNLGLEAFYDAADMEYNKPVPYLRDIAVIFTSTADAIQEFRAFLEKRKPVWKSN